MQIIDIHTHGLNGLDTRSKAASDILTIADNHGKQGVTGIILSIYPGPLRIMRQHIHTVRTAMKEQSSQDHSASIIGVHLEGPFLNPLRCGALNAESFLLPDTKSLDQLIDGFENIIKIITVAPELPGAEHLIRHISDKGIIVSMGHSDATYAEAQRGYHSGAKGITHLFNAMRGIHHREPGLAGFGLMHPEIYVEVIADPFHLNPQILEMIFRIKPPEKIIIISDSVRDALTDSGDRGIRDDASTLQGGCMTIKDSAERLYKLGLNKEAVSKAISTNPLTYLGHLPFNNYGREILPSTTE
ncbi:MAG: amidohydrolase family protein [Nitrospira sp.]|nr:amidohydrolase family protein [bacterium]MBL7048734.1 amidohydrolase family protein [Nitrospira sp.]